MKKFLAALAVLCGLSSPALAVSTFTQCYELENPAPGDQTNTWGLTENNGRNVVDAAIAGLLSKSLSAGGAIVLADNSGNTAESKNAQFNFTGVLPNNTTVLWPNGRCRLFAVTNNTTGAFSLTLCVNNGSNACAGTSVVLPQGQTYELYDDGTNISNRSNAVSGPLWANGPLNESSVTLASSSSVAIGAANANYIVITGTNTINSFDTIQQGVRRILVFSGALTLTFSANLILPSGINIPVAVGDTAEAVSEGGGVWRVVNYQTASGLPLVVPPGVPSGAVVYFGGSSCPTGFLALTGQAVSRTGVTANLFAQLGTTYGAGDGSTTFNVPDGRGRLIAGFDSGNATGRLTGAQAGGVSASSLGNTGGEQGHTLTVAELASHSHANTLTDPGHSHSLPFQAYSVGANIASIQTGTTQGTISGTLSATTGMSINNAAAGGGGAHNNIPPAIVLLPCIKT